MLKGPGPKTERRCKTTVLIIGSDDGKNNPGYILKKLA
jgi:hypothetical protein